MASSSKGAELGTQIEFTRPQKLSEQKQAKPDNLGISGAIGALNQDNPKVKDRTDLKNLAVKGRKYRRFDTMAQYREARMSGKVYPQNRRPESGGQKIDNINDEAKRVYDEPDLDPLIRQTNDEISSKTNLAPDVQAAFASNDPLTINQTWFNTRNRISAQTWGEFINKYPDKAASYAEKHQDIKAALEEIKRQEQARIQAQSREQVQAESDQLLADSVRVSENNQAQTAEQASENNVPEVTTTEVNAETEKGLLSEETTGVQATLLLGGEIGTQIDRAKIEAIAAGGLINTERANQASLGERQEYWNGENSPFKDMAFEQQLERWRGKMQEFFDQYNGKPEAEFFKRVGIDLENENAVMEIHQTYFVDGKGDLGLLTQKIAQNNSAEQIQENRDLIQKLGKMYGEKSAKVMVEMTIGIKNAQIDIDSFVQSAQAAIDKGDDMPGIDLIKTLYEDRGDSNKDEADQIQEHGLIWSQHASLDKWKEGGGDLHLNGDYLAFTPHIARLRNPYATGTTEYGYFEKYQVRYFKPDQPSDFFISEQRRRAERGIELAVNTNINGEMVKVPTPMFWEILEANPESVSGDAFDKYVTLEQEGSAVKSVEPVDLKIKNSEGTPREVNLNFSWRKLQVDKQTLVDLQNKVIDYLEQQVSAGNMSGDLLAAAKGIIDSHNAPKTVRHTWTTPKQNEGENVENPEIHSPIITTIERWEDEGELRDQGQEIVYEDKSLKKRGESRGLEIATSDPKDASKKILTKQAWDILLTVPKNLKNKQRRDIPRTSNITDVLTSPIRDRQGKWKRFVRGFTADAKMLSRIQGKIRTYVENNVDKGTMDQSVLEAIDGIAKYKHTALEPTRIGAVTYHVNYKMAEARAA